MVGADAQLTYQRSRSASQCSNQCCASAGGTKNSISICSNSRVRKMKLPGVISLRNDLPTCAIPNGGFLRENCSTFLKLMKMPCAVSGRRYAVAPDSFTGPIVVSNIRLKSRASVRSHSSVSPGCFDGLRPHASSARWSARKRWPQVLQSTSGSVKPARWPEASHTFGCCRIAESIATMSSRSCSIARHHSFLTFVFSSTP